MKGKGAPAWYPDGLIWCFWLLCPTEGKLPLPLLTEGDFRAGEQDLGRIKLDLVKPGSHTGFKPQQRVPRARHPKNPSQSGGEER